MGENIMDDMEAFAWCCGGAVSIVFSLSVVLRR